MTKRWNEGYKFISGMSFFLTGDEELPNFSNNVLSFIFSYTDTIITAIKISVRRCVSPWDPAQQQGHDCELGHLLPEQDHLQCSHGPSS